MTTETEPRIGVGAPTEPVTGLRKGVLSPWETLAQSISTMAPSTTPTLTIPLVYALAGEGSWLAYVIAALAMVLVALCIATFARDSSSSGSVYSYVRSTLPPVFSAMAAWALLFAYITTASSVIGGFLNYSYVFLGDYGRHVPPALLAVVSTAAAVWVAARDVKISSQIMLWIEATSVLLISIVLAVVLWRSGMHIDLAQLHLSGASWSGVRLGVVLAVFSFVGFESATALGEEAREPLKTIPRAVLQSALLTGLFFVVSVYAEVVGFAGAPHNLGASTAPLREISARYGLRRIGPVIDAGVLVSMFACTLACVTAASRVSMLMAQHGLAHKRLGRIHKRNATPASAVAITGLIAVLPPAILAQRGSSPADIYGWMGTLAVFGFLTTYGLAAIALPVYLRRRGRLTTGSFLLAGAAACVTVLLMLGTLYPLPPAPFRYFPFIYALYLGCGLAFYGLRGRRSTIVP